MRQQLILCALIVFSSASVCLGQTNSQTGGNTGGNTTTVATCPAFLLAEFNDNYFYQEKNCQTGVMLNGSKRYMAKVKTGCNGTTGCNCTQQPSGATQAEYADPNSRIFVPFGGGASSHLGPSKQLVQAGTKKFVVISMRFKGAPTGGSDNQLDCIVQFGQEVDPATAIPATNQSATLTGNALSFNGITYDVTLKGTAPPQSQQN